MKVDMPAATTEQQLRFLSELKSLGVKSVRIDVAEMSVLAVEFFPSSAIVEPGDITPKDMTMGGPEMCKCGHDETTHGQGGYCLRGCDIGKCGEISNGQ